MDERQKTIAALTIIASVCVLVIIIIGILISGKKVISPVPDEGAIKVIFISPTMVPVVAEETPTPESTPMPTKKVDITPTRKPTAVPTVQMTPTKTVTPTKSTTPTSGTTPTPTP